MFVLMFVLRINGAVLQLTEYTSILRSSPQPRCLAKLRHHLFNCVGALYSMTIGVTQGASGHGRQTLTAAQKNLVQMSTRVLTFYHLPPPRPASKVGM